jgi:hypothetical protein
MGRNLILKRKRRSVAELEGVHGVGGAGERLRVAFHPRQHFGHNKTRQGKFNVRDA